MNNIGRLFAVSSGRSPSGSGSHPQPTTAPATAHPISPRFFKPGARLPKKQALFIPPTTAASGPDRSYGFANYLTPVKFLSALTGEFW